VVTRSERLDDFVTDRDPPSDLSVELLCQDHVGTYVIPFLCQRADDVWRNEQTGETIEANVVGWRERRALHRERAAPAD
jgi:hypothetical protein